MEKINMVSNSSRREYASDINSFTQKNAQKVRTFHTTFPMYEPTPLVALKGLAKEMNVENIYVKDESYQFGLNAFKGLGGSYCIGRYIANQLGLDIDELTYEKINSKEVREQLGEITFVTATDGNHGRGIAWTARTFGQKAVVYMPKGSAAERLENIRKLGAEASITDFNYDETVAYAAECAKENGWVLVQDTAWDGYETIPQWIMEGYMTMALESMEQLHGVRPTHIFLQAGVGAMAGAVAGFFADCFPGEDKPIITIVEPDQADCFYQTMKYNDGKIHSVGGNLSTIMAGLACGVPCKIAWNVLKQVADHFISMPDYVAANGMRILGNPLEGDQRIISGESGASTIGIVTEILSNKDLMDMKQQLKLNEESVILCFSTEGDTDRENYRRIVWRGMC